ncbi:MAG: hybrid sensor histidine kinase/response regulator [Planctomycetota bacterium]|nr:MAG: hybrid sensor histidine kinase/response regulator [Planctomycetota bacterium]
MKSIKNEEQKVQTRKSKILVVDDHPSNLDIVKDTLGADYSLYLVKSGIKALEAARKILPDLILLDIMMPQMDGYEVLEKMKEDSLLASIPVIFLTAKTSNLDEAEGLSRGGVDYITKPFHPLVLKKRVELHLKLEMQKKKIQENYKKLKQEEKLRAKLVDMVAHDIRNPLMIVANYIEFTLLGLDAESPDLNLIKEDLEKSLAASKEIERMIETMLETARMDDPTFQVSLEVIDINDLVLEVQNEFQRISGERQWEIQEDTSKTKVLGDKRLLRRVLQNLFANAIHYSPKKSKIRIHFRIEEETYLQIGIHNESQTKNLENLDKIFDSFYQTDKNQKKSKGFGLGLSFCKMAIEAMKGRIWAESKQKKNSKMEIDFYFSLPLSPIME